MQKGVLISEVAWDRRVSSLVRWPGAEGCPH